MADGDAASAPGEFHRIGDQVAHDQRNHPFVGTDVKFLRQPGDDLQLFLPDAVAVEFQDAVGDSGEVEGLLFEYGSLQVAARPVEQILKQFPRCKHLIVKGRQHGVELLKAQIAGLVVLQQAFQVGKRALQVVRNNREKLVFGRIRLAELIGDLLQAGILLFEAGLLLGYNAVVPEPEQLVSPQGDR